MVIDWIMKTSTSEGKHGIQCTSGMQLDDLEFADDLALLSQTSQQMQEKTTSVAAASAAVGLNIHKGKSKILQYNIACTNRIILDGEALEEPEEEWKTKERIIPINGDRHEKIEQRLERTRKEGGGQSVL
ncbi:unnamed protein product [Schistosoma curassoni]|uniref:Reverse transcriptase domain-containing protein n=1 Tax=Schistosoma curassoni TaxID=6186 RepID=A0A183L1Q0_9TREM|nr:unnamed protein product [Schistosoma curassoni]